MASIRSNEATDCLEVTVPEGFVFVMGDNCNYSYDSRYDDVWLVDQRYLLGRVMLRITPFDKFGRVDKFRDGGEDGDTPDIQE